MKKLKVKWKKNGKNKTQTTQLKHLKADGTFKTVNRVRCTIALK